MKKVITALAAVTGSMLLATGCGSSGDTAAPADSAPAAVSNPGGSSERCADNTLTVGLVTYTWLDNGGVRADVTFNNQCDRPQRVTAGDFSLRETLADGSATVVANSAQFVFDGRNGGNEMPFIAPGASLQWTLNWERNYVGIDYAFSKPEIELTKLRVQYQFGAETQS